MPKIAQLSFDSRLLEMVGNAIANGETATITHTEAKALAKVAIDTIEKSSAPDFDAERVRNTLAIATNYANFARAETPAQALLNGLEVRIEQARAARAKELEPKFTFEEHKKAARVFGAVIREHIANDPECPPLWQHGAFSSIYATKDGLAINYDYEFLAGGDGENKEVEKFIDFVVSLIPKEPGLKKYEGIRIGV